MERLPCAPSRGPIESWQALRNRPASPQTKKLASPFSFLLPAEKQAVFLFPYFTQAAFLRGGAKRPACQWQERPLSRRELSESTETSGGRGSDPPRRLRLRKGEPFFGLQRTVPPQIFYFRFSQPRPPQSFARRRTGGLAKAGENTIE